MYLETRIFFHRMGRRTNPLAVRIKSLMNWPSDVSHPFLQQYIKHIFQHSLVATPHIRSSTTGLWVNVTLMQQGSKPIESHPKFKNPVLDFRGADLTKALGRMEFRTQGLTKSHFYYRDLFKDVDKKTLTAFGLSNANVNEALQIYRDTAINLKINVINNPLLNAEIMAQDIAHSLKKNVPLSRVFKTYLKKMS